MKKLFLAAAVLSTALTARATVLECGVSYLDKTGQWREPRQIYGVTCEPGKSPRFQSSASYPFHVNLSRSAPDGRRTLANEGYMVALSRVITLASYRFSYEGGKLAAVELSLGYAPSMCDVRDQVVSRLSIKIPLDAQAFELTGDVGTKESGEQPVRLNCRALQ